RRLEAGLHTHGAPRWKRAMHLLRLLTAARELLRTCTLTRDEGEQRQALLAAKPGEVQWCAVEALTTRLEREADEAVHHTPLPAEPDRRRVENFLVRVRRASALGPDVTRARPPA